jgi:hypothetical protein
VNPCPDYSCQIRYYRSPLLDGPIHDRIVFSHSQLRLSVSISEFIIRDPSDLPVARRFIPGYPEQTDGGSELDDITLGSDLEHYHVIATPVTRVHIQER